MAEPQEEKGGFIESPGLVVVAVIASIAIPLVGYFVAQLVGGRPAKDVSEEAVAARILPVAKVALARSAAAPAVAPTTAPAAAGAPAASAGKKVYDATCAACHGTGVAGAPKLGDKAAWAPRLKAGMDGLYASALKGKGAMPPKGGNTAVPDADIKAAVEYMANAAK